MNIYKDELVSEAIKTAINSFGKKNNLNGMDYFAEQFGFNGKNRSIQLHNHIYYNNLEKDLKLTMIFSIMGQMDQEEQKIILEALANKYGFFVKEKEESQKLVGKTIETVVTVSVLEIGSTVGSMDEDIIQAINDGELDKNEAKRILKSISDVEKKTRGLRDAIIEFLGE